MDTKIRSFQDLIAWQEGHKLAITIYTITEKFPSRESHSLVDQMRRCAVSITSNVAEGFSRKSKKEKMQFYYTSLGSVTELQNQLILSRDIQYLDKLVFEDINTQIIKVHKLINGLIKSSKDHT